MKKKGLKEAISVRFITICLNMANQLPKDVGENVERNYATHLASLGLDLSDSDDDLICYETMTESDEEEDALCNEAMDNFERQRAFQSRLIQQSGGAMNTRSTGTFEFELEPYVDRKSIHMGVRERHFNTRLRQTGNFVDTLQLVPALQDGLRHAVNRVLATTPDLHDRDRLYFTLSSNRFYFVISQGRYGVVRESAAHASSQLCRPCVKD